MAYFTKKNAKIFYDVYGEGEDWITLVNGYTRPSSDFKLMSSFLATQGKKILCFDNRGSGQTETVLDFSAEDYVRDIIDLWDHLGVQKSHLLGISMGGFIAQLLAQKHSHRLKSLILVSTSSNINFFSTHVSWPQNEKDIATHLSSYFHPDYVAKNKLIIQGMAKQVSKSNEEGSFIQKSQAQRKAMEGQSIDVKAANSIETQTLILHGEEDRVIEKEEASKLQKIWKASKLKLYKRIGHMILVENKNEFYRDVLNFINRFS